MVSVGPGMSGGLRPLRIGEILDTAIKIYTKRAWTLFRIVLIVAIPLEIVAFLLQLSLPRPTTSPQTSFGSPNFGQSGFGQQTPVVSGAQIGTFVAVVLTLGVLTVLLTLLATAACYRAIIDSYLGHEPDWKESFRFAFRRFGTLIGVAFVTTIISTIGFFLCFAPGVWLIISWLFCTVIVLTEGAGVSDSMRRSFGLVQGRWWRTFGTWLVGYLFTLIVGSLIGLLLGLILLSTDPGSTTNLVIGRLIDLVSKTLTIPFLAAFVTVMYFDARVRKEGFDLQLMAAQVGSEPPAGSPYSSPPRQQPGSSSPPGGGSGPAGSSPPYWPPPPGWTPPGDPAPSPPAPPGTSTPPGSPSPPPPPPGSAGGGSSPAPQEEEKPPYWPPPPGWKPRGGSEPPSS